MWGVLWGRGRLGNYLFLILHKLLTNSALICDGRRFLTVEAGYGSQKQIEVAGQIRTPG